MTNDPTKKSDAEFLKDLAKRVMLIPVKHNVDQYDSERLNQIASKLNAADQL